MKVKVNGKTQQYEHQEMFLEDLLKANNVTKPEMVSVQLNGKFLKREFFTQTSIKDRDEVEFLYFMGGGTI